MSSDICKEKMQFMLGTLLYQFVGIANESLIIAVFVEWMARDVILHDVNGNRTPFKGTPCNCITMASEARGFTHR